MEPTTEPLVIKSGEKRIGPLVSETVEDMASFGTGKAILVVEDEVLIRLDISHYLRARGYNVIEANNAARAIQILKNDLGVDVVFTDIRLPGMADGIDLANYVQTHFPHVAVLITTGHALTKELPQFFGQPIAKPYKPAHVLEAIEDQLKKRQSVDAKQVADS